ncbi:DUF1566 domain-containing protein [Salinispirillum sp. LH 10-3-1]|uniref:DUF1566 domain-containing protein n=1 Tax=Salinispirillum sp. LH 10-3-1 TaxID=2952525 RepID=A0AB38YHN5_9GAMM
MYKHLSIFLLICGALFLSACNEESATDNTDNNDVGGAAPTFANEAQLTAVPLANRLLISWTNVANSDTYSLYFGDSEVDQNSPTAGGISLAADCNTSPCVLPAIDGELTYIALLSDDSHTQSLVDFSQIMAVSGQINDSGAVRCYAPHTTVAGGYDVADCSASTVGTTQDALIGRDASAPVKLGSGSGGFDLTKLDSSGNPITDDSEHSCVRDNVTGLVWEVKTTTNRDVRYVWGTETDSAAGDVNAFVTATNNAGLCGLSNWRLPTANELFGLVDFDKPHGITLNASADGNINEYLSIDRDFFPNTRMVNQYVNTTTRVRHAHYWTSDTYLDQYSDPNYTLVDFFRGSLVNTSNPRANFVLFGVIHDGAFARLVSNGPEGVQP